MKSKKITTIILLITVCIAFGQTKKSEAEFTKLCGKIADAFAKKNIVAINKYINPQTGIYVITRPGAMDAIINQKKLDVKNPFKINYPYSDTITVKKHPIKYGTAPKFDCGSMKWNTLGFVADSSGEFNRLSEIMYFRVKYENEKYSNEDIEKKDTVERRMRKIVFTEIANKHGLVFYMSFIKGKWYLTVIDTVASNCAA